VITNHLFSFLNNFHLLFTIGIFGLVFALHSTPANRNTEKKRLTYLLVLSFLMGLTTGPLVRYIALQDPSIVFNAYMITLVVFGSFSLASLYADSTKFLGLGGKFLINPSIHNLFRIFVVGFACLANHILLLALRSCS
jgi:hypothetical protein